MAEFRMRQDQSLTFNSVISGTLANASITYRIVESSSQEAALAPAASITSNGVLTPSSSGLALVEAVYTNLAALAGSAEAVPVVLRRFAVQILSAAEVTAIESNNLTAELVSSGSSVPVFVSDVTVE